MPYPLPPGVYFEQTDPPIGAVVESRTDVAGFVGVSERGPLHEPVRVESWTQFETRFGRRFYEYGFLPDSVHGFFANGGRTAWIVRVGRPIPAPSEPLEPRDSHAGLFLVNAEGKPVFYVRAKDPGLGGGAISVRVQQGVGERFHLYVSAHGCEASETWRDLESNSSRKISATGNIVANDRYAVRVVNGIEPAGPTETRRPPALRRAGSSLIEVAEVGGVLSTQSQVFGVLSRLAVRGDAEMRRTRPFETELFLDWPAEIAQRSVLDGLQLIHFLGDRDRTDRNFGLLTLEAVDEVSLIAIPDLMWSEPTPRTLTTPVSPCAKSAKPPAPVPEETRNPLLEGDPLHGHQEMLGHCLRMRDRFAILDAPHKCSPEDVERNCAARLQSYAGQFGALYYPWIGVPSPAASVQWMPPSGHLAGVFARVDRLSGVQKSPANEAITEAQAVERTMSAEIRGQLNLAGVNVLASSAGRGVRVMGARTLIDASDPDLRQWQYVAVRRLLLMIEESLDETAQRFVHGGNEPVNWQDVEGVVRSFLFRLWRGGRLDGASPEEAFAVECSRHTNATFDHYLGRMTCEIGVQPPQPSEFVFVRLGDRGRETGTWKQEASRG